jgi:hypothetical protein
MKKKNQENGAGRTDQNEFVCGFNLRETGDWRDK